MYRTDKQFMKNPATNSSRIYVGQLPKTIVADDLEAKFIGHGKILGLLLHTGFAFIQYEQDHEAHKAIQMENGSILNGQKIVVRQASDRRGGNNQQQGPSGPPQRNTNFQQGPNSSFQGPNTNFQQKPNTSFQQSPKPSFQPGPKPNFQQGPPKQNFQQGPKPNFQNQKPPNQQQKPPQIQEPKKTIVIEPPPQQENKIEAEEEEEPPYIKTPSQQRESWGDNHDNNDKNKDKFNRNQPNLNRPPPHHGGGRKNFQNKPFRDEPPFYNGPPPQEKFIPPAAPYAPIVDGRADKNDCEIIVVSKPLTEYAEFIENRLKQLGLIVDLLFPNEDVPIGKVLANISSRGCLYAILVMPQNEENRSLTLNILHGLPQEHRNMPVEDALILITRNFEAYMRGETIPVEKPGEMTLLDKHPVQLQMALNMLAENRHLTSSQYDKLIQYLQDRRDLQYQFEVAEGIDQESQESTSKQAELQNRIMNILNKGPDSAPIPMSITATEPAAPVEAAPTPLLKDPTVQKALDSFLGDMFKNISEP
ncbi:unnamed protein product [Brassicogethes aeneus]|uniref:RRM domain-containing protein n=1 Tax=Brassicogethes aeneus TaxID=1431903 RepID=A0A9P0FAN5_BRAAE|nr:unnamed protein product [Brassicogethes aeneus]